MMSTVNEDAIREDYRYILTTLHDEAVNVPLSYAKEMIVYNSKKVKDFSFADDSFSFDVARILIK